MRRMRRVNIAKPDFEYDPEDPDGFKAGMARIGRQLGAKETGASVYELPPGQSVCPYHYEYGEEEWVLVLNGHPTVRTPEGSEQLDPFDVVFFPKGPDGAHQVRNDSDEPARVLMWSQIAYPTATAYPDSGKVGVYTGDRAEDLIVRRSSKVDYYDGELG
jgi:uncharacterized cupin superfamily protein